MKSIRVSNKSISANELEFELANIEIPRIKDDECLVEIHASGINPSDVKGLLGKMPYLSWPRTPGRDYAGIVVEGPSDLVGKEVWGTGGDLGMSRNGAHAEFNVINIEGIREKPSNLTMSEAGSIGVAWTCAWLGMVEGARVNKGETVVVLGANGKVGEASVQIASAAGANIIAVERKRNEYTGHSARSVDLVNLEAEPNLHKAIMDRTDGNGADIIMNTVGSPYFEPACKAMAKQGRQIIITTIIEENLVNLRTFYRGNHQMIGISNMDHNHIVSANFLEKMRVGFENNLYKPYKIKNQNIYPLQDAGKAYKTVLENLTRDRIIINPRA